MPGQLVERGLVGSSAARLHLYLLGPPRVEWSGQAVPVSRRQARALLYRLAADSQVIPRALLSCLFWPELSETTARRNLSRLLAILRSALPLPEIWIVTEDAVGLQPDDIWTDIQLFQRSIEQWKSHGRIADLQQGIQAYRGPFLAGFSLSGSPDFELWVTEQQEYWEACYLKALAALIETQATAADYPAAIESARRYLAVDDLAEEIHRRLIELYAISGDRTAALRQYEHCMVTLEREMGVRPLPATQAIYQSVLKGRPPRHAVLADRPAWSPLPTIDLPLFGREAAMQELSRIFAQVQEGQGAELLLSGEPGIGKTRMIQEFVLRLQGKAIILAGAGYPDARTTPYQPLVEALRPALKQGHFKTGPYPLWLSELTQLIPELCIWYPDLPLPPALGAAQSRARLFEALFQLLLRLASGQVPVVLFLDDLHRADSTTLDWLAYLGRHILHARMLAIGAYSTAESMPVDDLRHQLNRLGVRAELELQGLDQSAVIQLIRHQGWISAQESSIAAWLQQATGGNPLFILEILRAAVESGFNLEETASLETRPLPDTLRKGVAGRVARLSPKGRQVLEAGAVLGTRLDFNTVRLTAGRSEMDIIDGLDELVARQLLVDNNGDYRFRHEIVREVVVQGLSYWRRRVLHRRAGKSLERYRPADVLSLAWHYEQAEEFGRAARYALQAGQSAKNVFAHVEALKCFNRALDCLKKETPSLHDLKAMNENRRLRIYALQERGWALRLVGDMEAYACDLQEQGQLAVLLGDARILARLRWQEAAAEYWFCRYAQAVNLAQDGLRLSQQAGDPFLEAACWRVLGLAQRAVGDYVPAQAALEKALQLFTSLNEASMQVHTLGNLSTLFVLLGQPEQALQLASQARLICETGDLPIDLRLPLGDIGAAAAAAGDLLLAGQSLRSSLDIARRAGDSTQEIFCLGHLGWVSIAQGLPAQALEFLQPALALAEKIDSRAEQSWLLSGLASAWEQLGDLEAASSHACRAVSLARATGQAHDLRLAEQLLKRLENPISEDNGL